ncbi:alpha/beta hydrolase [Paenibacillus beijingensis]|uniref:Serine aminopeptidase S33 domain-containing protein n=1 Tax=Paenibacillus beijingensis TaxID=1126833 RepID=A0A0D5NGG4_9BACL|nr:alpha/beta fold hydrolase [Paenibacillus beijingensis]AJY74484.1 hypothetical protein VN24_07735 [Paenibacillus beijingensis]
MEERTIVTEPFVIDLGSGLKVRGEVRCAGLPGLKPVLLIAHGFKAFKDWGFFPYIAERFAASGFYTVTFNFSCNGVNETDFDELDKFAVNTYSREQGDLAAVLHAVQQRQLPLASEADARTVAVLGHSRGGGNAILFAAEHPAVKAVVTWNGVARANLFDASFEAEAASKGVAYTPNARTGQQMPISHVFFEDLKSQGERFNIAQRLSRLTERIPVLLVLGSADSERIVTGFGALREAAPAARHHLIEGAAHTFGAVHPFAGTTPALEEALNVSVRFFAENL